jgi:VWFA-related protein
MFRPAIATAGCLAVALNLVITAQQTPPPQAPPVFRTAVDLVHLDVSVLDKDRRPVRGLKAEDFVVLEDGKPQSIAAFIPVDVPENPPTPAAWSGRAPADVQSNEGSEDPEGRLFVLLLDDAMIPPDATSLKTARDVAKKFIDKVTPADRVAVVFSQSGRNQNFTNDRARLVEAIDSLKSGSARHLGGWETATDPQPPLDRTGAPIMPDPAPTGPIADPDMIYRQASMQTLRQVAETLISAPQRRKALVFISPGIAIDIASSAVPVSTMPLPADRPAGDPRSLSTRMSLIDANRQLAQDLPQLFLRMQRANVTVYPVDPCGAGGFENYVLTAASSVPLLQMDNGSLPTDFNFLYPGQSVPRPTDLAKHMSTLTMDFLESAAANTGGKAIVNTNDFDAGIQEIFDENSSYYVIGYEQPAGQKPGSLHDLKVRVNRSGVTVRTRSGYETPAEPRSARARAAVAVSPLDKAIVGAVPDGSFPMRVAMAPFVIPGKKDPIVTVALGLTQPAVTARTSYFVDVQTNVYTTDGRPKLTGQRHTATVVLVPTPDKSPARYDLLTQLSLPPGRYEVRFSAMNGTDSTLGSLYADVEVPDFSAPLSVSGVVVEAIPSAATAPIGAFDKFLPVSPTSERTFAKNQQATAFMRIYQGGTGSAKPVEVRARLLNELDAQVGEGRTIVYGNEFRMGGRAADYRFGIPLKTLPPGLYLLTFDIALDGNTVQRAVQFRVTAK